MKFPASFTVKLAAGAVFLTALVFLSAGRLDYWQGWVYLSLSLGFLAATGWVLRHDKDLVSERLHPGKGTKWWDKGYLLLSTPLSIGAVAVGAIDAGRGHWGRPPKAALYAAAAVLYVLGQALFLWAKKSNPFFSSVVRLQEDRGQTVCREGPYRICRHPGYLGGLVFGLTTPILLGSLWALIPQILASLLLLARTFFEDRMLTRDLLWYAEYRKSVPARLLPGLW